MEPPAGSAASPPLSPAPSPAAAPVPPTPPSPPVEEDSDRLFGREPEDEAPGVGMTPAISSMAGSAATQATFVIPERLPQLYERLVADIKQRGGKAFIFAASDIDSICALHILMSLLTADSVPCSFRPVASYEDLLQVHLALYLMFGLSANTPSGCDKQSQCRGPISLLPTVLALFPLLG